MNRSLNYEPPKWNVSFLRFQNSFTHNKRKKLVILWQIDLQITSHSNEMATIFRLFVQLFMIKEKWWSCDESIFKSRSIQMKH